jgi:hypothetical protein
MIAEQSRLRWTLEPSTRRRVATGGYVIVMRHASSPRDVPDKRHANADNVNLERQLDEAGRASATAMGKVNVNPRRTSSRGGTRSLRASRATEEVPCQTANTRPAERRGASQKTGERTPRIREVKTARALSEGKAVNFE